MPTSKVPSSATFGVPLTSRLAMLPQCSTVCSGYLRCILARSLLSRALKTKTAGWSFSGYRNGALRIISALSSSTTLRTFLRWNVPRFLSNRMTDGQGGNKPKSNGAPEQSESGSTAAPSGPTPGQAGSSGITPSEPQLPAQQIAQVLSFGLAVGLPQQQNPEAIRHITQFLAHNSAGCRLCPYGVWPLCSILNPVPGGRSANSMAWGNL
jgi:hypothetical protein